MQIFICFALVIKKLRGGGGGGGWGGGQTPPRLQRLKKPRLDRVKLRNQLKLYFSGLEGDVFSFNSFQNILSRWINSSESMV